GAAGSTGGSGPPPARRRWVVDRGRPHRPPAAAQRHLVEPGAAAFSGPEHTSRHGTARPAGRAKTASRGSTRRARGRGQGGWARGEGGKRPGLRGGRTPVNDLGCRA